LLSRRTKYAIHSLLALAEQPDAAVGTAALQTRCGGSRPYLEAVLSSLVREGLVTSIRGRTGGFRLARPAAEISFAEVIRIFDGPLALTPCASQTRPGPCLDCIDPVACAIRPALVEARDRVADVLERTTLASALGDPAYSAGA
jgi:Rrf2 family protein